MARNCWRTLKSGKYLTFKLRCDERFTHAFTACGCVFNEITLVGSNQGNYFENATACSKRTLKTTVATRLYGCLVKEEEEVVHNMIFSDA
jgi:hypothetical protein